MEVPGNTFKYFGWKVFWNDNNYRKEKFDSQNHQFESHYDLELLQYVKVLTIKIILLNNSKINIRYNNSVVFVTTLTLILQEIFWFDSFEENFYKFTR